MYMERPHEKDGKDETETMRDLKVLYGQHTVHSNAGSIRIPNWEGRTDPYTVEELHQSIRQAEADVAAGRLIPAEVFLRKMKEKYRR